MVVYDWDREGWDREGWVDPDDRVFFIDMTPENEEDCEHIFRSQVEFYRWWYNVHSKPD